MAFYELPWLLLRVIQLLVSPCWASYLFFACPKKSNQRNTPRSVCPSGPLGIRLCLRAFWATEGCFFVGAALAANDANPAKTVLRAPIIPDGIFYRNIFAFLALFAAKAAPTYYETTLNPSALSCRYVSASPHSKPPVSPAGSAQSIPVCPISATPPGRRILGHRG